MTINYGLFGRLMGRSAELAQQPGIPAIVSQVYEDRLKAPAEAFLAADAALTKAVGARRKEHDEASAALAALDRPYAIARATALAYMPRVVLPESLKSLRTDTDKMDAIEKLLEVVEEQAGEPWAAGVLGSEFGTLAPAAVQEIDEAIGADGQLSAARGDRARAYGVAYSEYLSFKRVVRHACGPKSREYHRIHVRNDRPEEPQED